MCINSYNTSQLCTVYSILLLKIQKANLRVKQVNGLVHTSKWWSKDLKSRVKVENPFTVLFTDIYSSCMKGSFTEGLWIKKIKVNIHICIYMIYIYMIYIIYII